MVQKKGIGKQTLATKTYTDHNKRRRPLSIPLEQAVNYQAESSQALGEDFRSGSEFVYQRFGHPTLRAASEKIAALEKAEAGLIFSSGMGAISTTLLALSGPAPSHVMSQRDIFAQTFTFLNETLRGFGVETDFINVRKPSELKAAFRPNTRFVYIESPSNPLIGLTDIAEVSSMAGERGVPVLIDSTFGTPYLQNPLEHGASLVLHSATKFLAGHSDVLCGAVAGKRELIAKVEQMQILTGTILDPHACWLLLRGIKTLGVRVQKQAESALAIARLLVAHTETRYVNYPFLESSPDYALAKRQMLGGGGVLSFELKGGNAAAKTFVNALELIPIATSLGGVESIIEIPFDLDFSGEELGEAANKSGISPGLIRLSVGIEDLPDLLADIEKGMSAVSAMAEVKDRQTAVSD